VAVMLARSGVARRHLIDVDYVTLSSSNFTLQPPSLTSGRRKYNSSHARCMLSHRLCRSIHVGELLQDASVRGGLTYFFFILVTFFCHSCWP
jgi:tRNA A37 threonylcarbamoyladenosine dehydratase